MNLLLSKEQILSNLIKQIDSFFSIDESEIFLLGSELDQVLDLCEICFSGSNNKYFKSADNQVQFNPLHSVQYMVFLYLFGHHLYKKGKTGPLCDKLYYLNKAMNGVDIFYAVDLPDYFGAEHPVASVLGRAKYGNGFIFYQGCTVGGNYSKDGYLHYPEIGCNVIMYANSSIIGKCKIGNNVILSAGAMVKNMDVPDNSIVFGQSPDLVIKPNKRV